MARCVYRIQGIHPQRDYLRKHRASLPKRAMPNKEKATMSTQHQEAKKPRILIIGSTGRIGRRVISEIAKVDAVEAVFSSRTPEPVAAWHNGGKEALFLTLDRPQTFPEALTGAEPLFLP